MDKGERNYKGYRMLIVIAYICMFTFGLVETIKGAIIPSIRAEFLVNYTRIGQMLFLSSLGYLMTTFFGGIAIQKFGLKKILLFGVSIVAISAGLFSITSSFYGVVAAYLLLGTGLGCFEGVNTLAGKIFVKNQAMMMNLMHFFFGVGASIAPRYAGVFIQGNYSWKSIYLPVMIAMLAVLIIILVTKFPEMSADSGGGALPFKELIKSPKVWLISFALGFFVIFEIGITNWLVNYLQVTRSLDIIRSTTYLTAFFITFTLGRLVGGIIADKLGYIKSLFYCALIGSIVLFGGILLGERFIFLFSITGFFVSITFPTMLVLIIREYEDKASTVIGFAITMCGILNMIGSWVIGKINDQWGVSVGMASVGISGIVTCLLALFLSKQLKEHRVKQ